MGKSADRFAQLLTEAVRRIRLTEGKAIQIIQDELGYAMGREGGSAIEYWRKGHIPPTLADVERLALELVRRGRLERGWLRDFLVSAEHPYPDRFCERLFPPNRAENQSQASRPDLSVAVSDLTAFHELDPFIVGLPIIHPRRFFGREYELKRIFNLWRRFPLQNVAVIGPKRSGKTSLLHYLKNITMMPPAGLRANQSTDWLPQPDRYRWVFVDFQDVRLRSRAGLLRHILTGLALNIPAPCDLPDFMDVVSTELQGPAIILMDEIGTALTSSELDEELWWSFRSLGTNQTAGNLAFLLTAHEKPWFLAEEQGISSPFFNIFGHTFQLGPLQEAEALELIASSPYAFDPADIDWILAESQRWPALLQILCHVRLTALEFDEVGDGWQVEGKRQIESYAHLLTQ